MAAAFSAGACYCSFLFRRSYFGIVGCGIDVAVDTWTNT